MAHYIQPESPQLSQLKTQLKDQNLRLENYAKDREHLMRIIKERTETIEEYECFILDINMSQDFTAWKVARRMEE